MNEVQFDQSVMRCQLVLAPKLLSDKRIESIQFVGQGGHEGDFELASLVNQRVASERVDGKLTYTGRLVLSLRRLWVLVSVLAILASSGAGAAEFGCGLNLGSTTWNQVKIYTMGQPGDVGRFWPAWDSNSQRLRPPDFGSMRRAGFNFVRIPVHPVPLMTAESAADLQRRVDALVELVQAASEAGLAVIVAMAPSDPDAESLKKQVVEDQPEASDYLAALSVLSTALQSKIIDKGRSVALEFLNEPTPAKDSAETQQWLHVQRAFLTKLRANAATLPILLMSDDWASIDGLSRLDLDDYRQDKNIWVAFHYYDPAIVTKQGTAWSSTPLKYLDQIPYPAPSADPSVIEGPSERVIERDVALSPAEKANTRKTLHNWISYYLQEHWGYERMLERFTRAGTWADNNGIIRSHVIADEIGIIRRPNQEAPGPSESVRAAWLADVTRAATVVGFGWAVWADVGPFGIDQQGGKGFDTRLIDSILPAGSLCKLKRDDK